MKSLLDRFFILGILLFFSSTAFCQDEIKVTAERNNDNSITFRYEKYVSGTYTIYIHFGNVSNTHASDFSKVVDAQRGILYRLTPIDKKKPIRYSYQSRYLRGIVNPQVDSLFVYALPFPVGQMVFTKESQNAREKYLGHEIRGGWKGYSFYSDANDTVCAVRKGIVVRIKDEFEADTLKTKKFTSKRNRILIEHEDGTFAQYSNLDKNNIFVFEGQEVVPQMPLALLNKSSNVDKYYLGLAISYTTQKTISVKPEQHFLKPRFLTETGITFLKNNQEYKVVISDELLNKEFINKKKRK